jgi:uncharacterized membrane protein YczE
VSITCEPVPVVPASRWRPSPARLARLLVGLCLFGLGESLIIRSQLGNSPWTVLAQGVAVQADLGVGLVTIGVSFLILLAWIPLRQRPGLGTIVNAVVVGVALDVVLGVLHEPTGLLGRTAMLTGGILLVAVGSGLYLTTFLGPGPRDGLMTGLHRRTGASIAVVRTTIEVSALALGWALGGTLGIGTLAFALAIGPLVSVALSVMARDSLSQI